MSLGQSDFMSCPLTTKNDSENLRRRSTHEAKYLIGKRIVLHHAAWTTGCLLHKRAVTGEEAANSGLFPQGRACMGLTV